MTELFDAKLNADDRPLTAAEPRVSEGLLSMENVVPLPHLGSASGETRVAMGMRVVANVRDFFAGKTPRDKVV